MDAVTNPQDLIGRTVYGTDGEKIGKAGQVYLDDATGNPEWLTVHTGFFGTRETFVPLAGTIARGNDLVVAYERDLIKNAPNVDVDDGHLEPDQERELFAYYGIEELPAPEPTQQQAAAPPGTSDAVYAGEDEARYVKTGSSNDGTLTSEVSGTGMQTGAGVPPTAQNVAPSIAAEQAVVSGREQAAPQPEATTVDTSGSATGSGAPGSAAAGTDDAMTRSEERIHVSTETRPRARARLRKYVTTEMVTTTVPVKREHVELVEEPITDAEMDNSDGTGARGPSRP